MNEAPGEALLRRLARRAAERDRMDDEHVEANEEPRLKEARRPLDAAARARIVEHLEAMHLAEQSGGQPEAEERGTDDPEVRSRLGRWWLPLAAVLLIFLAVLVYRSPLLSGGREVTVAALPAYALSVEGVVQRQRGGEAPAAAPGPTHRLAPGNRLRVTLTPERAAEGPLSAYASILDPGGERAVDPALIRISDQGAVRLDALIGSELEVRGRSARLLVIVGAEAALPGAAEAAAASAETGRASGEGWQAFALALEIVEPP